MRQQLVLVDEDDNPIGTGEKEDVHRSGQLHRAFSIFVFDDFGRLLLQQRAARKYHSGSLWSNTCCSHPGPGQDIEAAARQRLREEMGFSCPLRPVFGFVYRAELDNGFIEHEYDHVLVGTYSGEVEPDPGEVSAWKWADPSDLRRQLKRSSQEFTYWFRIAFGRLLAAPPQEMRQTIS